MSERAADRADSYWREACDALVGVTDSEHGLLNTASVALDAIWDREVFAHTESFGGSEIAYAGALSAGILARLVGVEYAALASVSTSSSLPPSGSEVLDEALVQARHDALDTFAGELLGPVTVEDHLVYAQPIVLDSPVPVGAVLVAAREALEPTQTRLLQCFLRELDTRMTLAEQILKLRKDAAELRFEVRKLSGDLAAPEAPKLRRPDRAPVDFAVTVDQLAKRVPSLELFGIELPTVHFDEFCGHFDALTDRYLAILEQAPNLYLDVPSGIDAKDESAQAAPYLRLLEVMASLRHAARSLYHADADELAPITALGQAPTFADLTDLAKKHTDSETVGRVLELMNDQGEEEEVGALAARSQPYEFRTANVGEVFALLALHRTVMDTMPERLEQVKARILAALPKYQAARAFLLAYDRFEDVPVRGVPRFQLPESEKLLLHRENAPAFGILLWALRQHAAAR